MTLLIQTLMDGIAVGSLYALIALGYTLVYGILQFINFAHSDVFALGAWSALAMAGLIGLAAAPGAPVPPWYVGLGVLLASMALCASVAFAIERFAYRPLRNAPRLNVLITAIGVSLLLQNVGQLGLWKVERRAWVPGNTAAAGAAPQGQTPTVTVTLPFGPYPKA